MKGIKKIGIITVLLMLTAGIAAGTSAAEYARAADGAAGDVQLSGDADQGHALNATAAPGQVLVSFGDGVNASIIERCGGRLIGEIKGINCALVEVGEGNELYFIDEITAKGGDEVSYAEPNYIAEAFYTPNDPLYASQWGPQAIKADGAWNTQKGSSDVTIAIIDTGIDYNHEDLGNYVSLGYDWANDDSDPMDDNGHGTHCAGIAAAVINNSVGISGVANVSVMAEKVLNETGYGSYSWVASGIIDATDEGASVISMSLGGPYGSSVLRDACQYAYDHGCLVVAATGNDNDDVKYPAKYDTVLAVGAINQNNERCDPSDWGSGKGSNYGSELELMAPGNAILSTYPGSGYASMSGTSMACPHVSGVAALVWSNCPIFTNHGVREQLKCTADDLGDAGWDQYYGWGRVDANEALVLPDISVDPESYELEILEGGVREYFLTIGNDGAGVLTFALDDVAGELEIFSDDIELCPGTWTHGGTDDEWECGPPDPTCAGGPPGAHSGSNCWGTDLDNTYNSSSDQWLISEAIDLSGVSGVSGVSLRFYRWCDLEVYFGNSDFGYVEISTNGTAGPWIELKEYVGRNDNEQAWIEEKIDISFYAGSSDVRIRFRLDSDFNMEEAGLYIDDVVVMVDWLSLYPTEGTVYPGENANVTVACDAADLDIGIYNATIVITSNDPDENPTNVSVNLTVLAGGDPDIRVEPEPFEIDVPQGREAVETLKIENRGTGVLWVYGITDTAYTTIIDDCMEPCPGNWTSGGTNNEWECGTPTYGPTSAHSGSNCWGTDLDSTYGGGTDQWLMSEVIDLSGVRSASLSFYRWYQIYDVSGDLDYGCVEISTTGDVLAGPWIKLAEYKGSSETWTREGIDISSYTGSSDVRIRFRLWSDWGGYEAGLYIDDIVVNGSVLHEEPTFDRVYPDENTSINVTVAPLDFGIHNATIIIANNDPDENPKNVSVNVTVEPANITVNPDHFDVVIDTGISTTWNDTLEIGNDGPGVLAYDISDASAEPEPADIIYDDSEWDYGWALAAGGGQYAVRFTPPSYPAELKTARIRLADFDPPWPDNDHEEFRVNVYNGTASGPDTLLGSVTTTAADWGWWDVDISGLGIRIDEGDFYIAYQQLADYPDCEALSIDEDTPDHRRSWKKYATGEWGQLPVWSSNAPYGNWMIRCAVDCGAPIQWLEEEPKTGIVNANDHDNITVTIDATGLPSGTYNATIVIDNNDPNTRRIVPINLTVIVPCGCVGATRTFACGSTVTESCTLNCDMNCPAGSSGLIASADDIVIDGAGYKITGNVGAADCGSGYYPPYTAGESNPAKHSGVIVDAASDVVLRNLEIAGFCTGIGIALGRNTTVMGCDIHDNGNAASITHGIQMICPRNCTIWNNSIYNNTGNVCGCGGGGNGVFMYGGSAADDGDHNNITHNDLANNTKAGVLLKKKCAYNVIEYNNVTGHEVGGIVLRCGMSDHNIVRYNNVSDNLGSGIFLRGTNNTVRNNTVTGSKNGSQWAAVCGGLTGDVCGSGVGVRVHDDATEPKLYNNTICDNEYWDIEDNSGQLVGDDNTCAFAHNYHDVSAGNPPACVYQCPDVWEVDLQVINLFETWHNETYYNITYTVVNYGWNRSNATDTGIRIDDVMVDVQPVPELDPRCLYTNTSGPHAIS